MSGNKYCISCALNRRWGDEEGNMHGYILHSNPGWNIFCGGLWTERNFEICIYRHVNSSHNIHATAVVYYSTCTVVCRRRWTGTDDKMRCNEARERERLHTSCIVNYGSGNIKTGNLQAVDVMVELSSPSRLVLAGGGCCWSFSVTSPSFYLPCHRSRKVNYVLSLICCSVDYTIIPWPTTRMTTYSTRPVSPTSHHVTILWSVPIYLNKSSCGLALVVIPLSVSTNWDFTQISFFNELGFWRPPLPLGLGLESTPPTTGHIYRKMNDGRWRDH